MAERLDENTAFVNGDIIPITDLPDGKKLETNDALIAAHHIMSMPDDEYIAKALKDEAERDYQESHSAAFFTVKQMIEDGIARSVANKEKQLEVQIPSNDAQSKPYTLGLAEFLATRLARMIPDITEQRELIGLFNDKAKLYLMGQKQLARQAMRRPTLAGDGRYKDAASAAANDKRDE